MGKKHHFPAVTSLGGTQQLLPCQLFPEVMGGSQAARHRSGLVPASRSQADELTPGEALPHCSPGHSLFSPRHSTAPPTGTCLDPAVTQSGTEGTRSRHPAALQSNGKNRAQRCPQDASAGLWPCLEGWVLLLCSLM